jgi:integrase
LRAWKKAKLDQIGLHEARRTFASLMIAAGVNAKALATYMGHSSVVITYDRYGHLMPGNETVAAELLDSYIAQSVADVQVSSAAGS